MASARDPHSDAELLKASRRDPEAFAVIRPLKRRRGGPQLFCYRNGGGWAPVRSDDVNAYIREHTDGPHSAKDFRTWHATVLAAIALAVLGGRAKTEAARRRVASHATREVSRYLGNTPTVCRACYIHPRVIQAYMDRTFARSWSAAERADSARGNGLRPEESVLLALLRKRSAA